MKRIETSKAAGLSPLEWSWARGQRAADDAEFFFEQIDFAGVWAAAAPTVVPEYARRYPGHRPPGWWMYGDGRHARRRHLGGSGKPDPQSPLHLGVPTRWTHADPETPPLIESQPKCLHTRKLLVAGEFARIASDEYEAVEVPLRFLNDGTAQVMTDEPF